ncbi:MAG: hypothetical protein K0R38_6252 [Polyangiaceae bacterium]|jgi:hypothetical protein|nr:hypothetical protein [Polyangiaceae bacterium]
MTVHPLSICRQLPLEFPDVARSRFEFDGWDVVYRVQLNDGASADEKHPVLSYLAKNSSMGVRPRLAAWLPGPPAPALFDGFSADQLSLLAASDPTEDGLVAALIQAFDFLADAQSETVDAGVVQITVTTKSPIGAGELNDCERFARAVLSAPGVSVTVVQGAVQPIPESGANLPFLVHQGSRDGIVDPVLLRHVRHDEDVYRDARRAKFPSLTAQDGLSVLLPVSSANLNLRNILPLYDLAYAPLEGLVEGNAPYGVTWKEIVALVRCGRLVPVVTRRVGEYDQRRVLELLEAGRVVLPRELTARTAATILDGNPLWRVAGADLALATHVVRDVQRELQRVYVPGQLGAVIGTWAKFAADGVANFEAAALRQGGLLPLAYGPGAFAAELVRLQGERSPDVEAMITGMQVTHAMALGAGCVPEPDPTLYPLYELTTLVAGARHAEATDVPLKRLPVVAELDKILDSISLTVGTGEPILEWIEACGPRMIAVREGLTAAFATSDPATRAAVQETAAKLEWETATFVSNRTSLARSVERFEVLGFASDALSWLTDANFPFAGTFIGLGLKHGFPKVWEALGKNTHTLAARDVLEGIGARVSPNVVRLHRAVGELQKPLRGG